MNHHAYFVAGDIEEGIARAQSFAEDKGIHEDDIETFRFALFSVEEARRVRDIAARRPPRGSEKLVIIAASRLFHEAQNALLKVFEEPPEGVLLALVVPSEGMLIETLRSRVLPLPGVAGQASRFESFATESEEEREKVVAKLLERAKSDKGEEKQAARAEVLALFEGVLRATYALPESEARIALLADLNRMLPILHERSAPLKPMLEHLLIVLPEAFPSR